MISYDVDYFGKQKIDDETESSFKWLWIVVNFLLLNEVNVVNIGIIACVLCFHLIL